MARMMSGIQPTGSLHIGNYLGALKNWVAYQQQYDSYFAIVDLHALTIRPDPQALRQAVREIAIGILACGVDPKRATLFVQSHVPQHVELGWILTCLTPMGDLQRMTQFKDKSQSNPDNINAGLFSYPALQTADIVLYRGEHVPVGEDQVQHLELARETVRRFNGLYGPTFPEPKPVLSIAPRVMGTDGESKMSKSKGNHIGLFESKDDTWTKLRAAKTDPQRLRRSDPGNPEVCNIFSYHKYFSDAGVIDQVQTECRRAGIGCVDCKQQLLQQMELTRAPIRDHADRLRQQPNQLDAILADGAERARREAEVTMTMVRERIGLR